MNLSSADQTLQLVAWFLALAEFIVALYVLLLNAWHTANRHVSGLLLLFAANNFALGLMIGATDTTQAAWPTYILAATIPAVQPGLLLIAIVLLKPHWLRGKWRRCWWLVYGLAFLPVLLTLVDVLLGTRLWYTGLDAAAYAGGYVERGEYTAGRMSLLIRVLNIYLLPLVSVIPLLYIALRDKEITPPTRGLARLLLGTQVTATIIMLTLRGLLDPVVNTLITSTLFVLAYAYAAFQQMISERRLQRGRLVTRVTALMLGIALPLTIAVAGLVGARAGELITQSATERLSTTNRALASNTSTWLNLNAQALQELVSLPDIISMDPERQKPFLEAMAAAYPYIYLVSTTDRDGLNVARSDDLPPQDYSDRLWQIGAQNGAPLKLDVMVDHQTGQASLVASAPIRRELGTIVGVGMFASNLADLTQAVGASTVGETGFAYIVDAQNQLVAHPELMLSAELRDLDTYPPVFALRGGEREAITFTDDEGQRWRAYVDQLENGWGVVVQQQESEFLSGLTGLRQMTWALVLVGAAMLSALTWLTIRQTFRPIGQLTATATAIAVGDLDRRAPVGSEDEIGLLAQAFNSMTEQLRALIGGLERRVAARTRDLERRSAYLEASAEVSHAAASILEADQLIREVVELIRQQFDLYYVGLFQMDEAGEWAVLRAGTGEAGQAMLARGHRIRIGEGMIGWSVANAQARVALEAGTDVVRLATAELPETRSEAAIPLRSRGQVLGALTVQDTRPGAFDQTAIAALQTMADQVAVALDNARLLAESQAALEAARQAYGELSRQAWLQLLRTPSDLGFRSDEHGLSSAQDTWRPEMERALQEGRVIQGNGADVDTGRSLAVPIRVGGDVIGVLDTYKPDEAGDWTPEEVALLQEITEQLALALDNARLHQNTQLRAAREQLTAEITARMRETLDIETVLKTAMDEIYQALGLEELTIYLSPEMVEGKERETS